MFNAFVQECAGAIFAKLSAETLGLVSVGVSAGGLVATMLHILLIAVDADELTLGFISLLVGTMVSLGLIPMTYGLTRNSYFRSFKTSLTHQEQISHRISLTQDKDVCLRLPVSLEILSDSTNYSHINANDSPNCYTPG